MISHWQLRALGRAYDLISAQRSCHSNGWCRGIMASAGKREVLLQIKAWKSIRDQCLCHHVWLELCVLVKICSWNVSRFMDHMEMDLGFSPQRFSWFCTCVILSPHTRVELAACLHLSVNQPVVHHNDRSLKEQGGTKTTANSSDNSRSSQLVSRCTSIKTIINQCAAIMAVTGLNRRHFWQSSLSRTNKHWWMRQLVLEGLKDQ